MGPALAVRSLLLRGALLPAISGGTDSSHG